MAQAPTLYQFDLALNHTDRGVSETLSVRTARHPSETLERVWLRVLAYAWHWQERIEFGPGLSDPDAPDLVATDLRGEVRLWVRVGKATDAAKIQRTADQHSRADVAVFFESPERMQTFIDTAHREQLGRLGRVALAAVDPALVTALAGDDERRTRAQITIAGDHFYIERKDQTFDGAITRGTI
jgi:uncharacterized protein YaeQ